MSIKHGFLILETQPDLIKIENPQIPKNPHYISDLAALVTVISRIQQEQPNECAELLTNISNGNFKPFAQLLTGSFYSIY